MKETARRAREAAREVAKEAAREVARCDRRATVRFVRVFSVRSVTDRP
ncbi:hypothetical protein GCM10010510_37550 [Streptomyces anandii JCM 4720]|nr:hypothetical protein GCM10010510_37550 [Streptomyces anandii JCM 4720]